MLCKCHWIVLYTVHFTAFCLGGPFLSGHGVDLFVECYQHNLAHETKTKMPVPLSSVPVYDTIR